MPKRRKTCESCKRRLTPAEDYWCGNCRSAIHASYSAATNEFDERMRDVPAARRKEEALKIAEEMLDRMVRLSKP